MSKPDKNCPLCEGKGIEQREWDVVKREYKIEVSIIPCELCFASFDKVHKYTETLELQFSGNARHLKGMQGEDVEANWSGTEGNTMRRLLKWLWNPENEPKSAYPIKGEKRSTPFRKLFAFEPKVKPPKHGTVTPPAPDARPAKMGARVAGRDLAVALKDLLTVVEKRSCIPILSCVQITASRGELDMRTTDLESWREYRIPVDAAIDGSCCLSARKLYEIARLNPGEMQISTFEDDSAEILTRTGRYMLIGLPVDNFPCRIQATNAA